MQKKYANICERPNDIIVFNHSYAGLVLIFFVFCIVNKIQGKTSKNTFKKKQKTVILLQINTQCLN